MKQSIIVSLLFILFSIVKSEAQTPCPPSYGDLTWPPLYSNSSMEPWPLDSWGNVNYKSRNIVLPTGTRHEIKVDWTSLSNNHRYNLTDAEFKSLMYKAIIKTIANNTGTNPCNFAGTQEFVFYEESNCVVNKVCYFKVTTTAVEIACIDDGFTPPLPTFTMINGVKYFGRLTETVSCNTISCCEIIYHVECIDGNVHIASITRSSSGCPQDDSNVRCKDNMPMQCTAPCN